jgi:putative SOS response-associated peptidase YedK
MCGRYTNTADPSAIEQRFGVPIPFSEGTGRYNIAPTEDVVGIVLDRQGQPVARPLRWGLIPSWSDDPKVGNRMINARVETVSSRPAYRQLIERADRRALLAADGFYEWLRSEDPKQPRQPFRFTVDGGRLFALAGLWTPTKIDGEWIASVTMLTTTANRVVAPLHDRMPVILPDRASELAWLDPAVDAAAARALCVPLADDRLRATPANPAINKPVKDAVEGPELLRAQ